MRSSSVGARAGADDSSARACARRTATSCCRRPRLAARSTAPASASRSMGFSSRSTAPCCMALTAVCTSAWPVSTMTASSGSSARRASRATMPLASGRRRSRRTTSGACSLARRRPSVAVAAPRAVWPNVSKNSTRVPRTVSSSSMTRIESTYAPVLGQERYSARHRAHVAAVAGSVRVSVVPCSCWLSMLIVPPCSSMMRWHSARPIPVPPVLVE